MLVAGLGLLAVPPRAVAQRAVGIDVSDYQSSGISWSTLKNTYGISFGWAKCSEGTGTGSGYGGGNFTTYEANAKAAGVLIGAYHYARYDLNTGTSGATAEANAFWSIAGPYIKGGGYYIMPMLDVEASFTGYTKTTLSQWVNQWCITVSNNAAAAGVLGVKPCIYCSSSHAAAELDSTVTQWNTDIADWYSDHSTALASAQAAASPPAGITPWTPSSNWQFWQYDDQNAAEAYTTGDGDIYHGTLAQLQASPLVIGGSPPAITSQPASQTVLAGANVTFSVGVSGATPFSYQWRYNGGNIGGATLSSFTTNNVQPASGGSYSVVVTNSYGTTNSANAVLTVHAPPAITNQPASQIVLAGSNVTFTVGATGTLPLAYQWRFNGNNLSGATLSSFTTNNVQLSAAGNYSVVVTNSYGTTNSANAVLTVHAPPVITTQPANATTGLGLSAAFSVTATGSAPLSYQWQRNGGSLAGATTSLLTITNAQATNAGTYAVVVTNLYGTATSSNALLAVLDPYITNQPQSQLVAAGAPASLSVGAVGTAPLRYVWSENGVALADGGNLSGTRSCDVDDWEHAGEQRGDVFRDGEQRQWRVGGEFECDAGWRRLRR